MRVVKEWQDEKELKTSRGWREGGWPAQVWEFRGEEWKYSHTLGNTPASRPSQHVDGSICWPSLPTLFWFVPPSTQIWPDPVCDRTQGNDASACSTEVRT